MAEGPTVTVKQGALLGRVATTPTGVTYYSFQGIPYARPPVGSLRFKEPRPAESWEGVRDATVEGNLCAQIQTFPHNSGFIGGEDCLFINVYTPNLEGEFLPVMFWSNSGTFDQGSGNSDIAGPEFIVEKDVVLVTFNYRTGPLGFLGMHTADAPGNAGLKDQALALKWVEENIGSFGGNSRNITAFGEGAGGASISYLTLAPSTKDVIDKAILQSGTSLNQFALVHDPVDNAKELAKHLGCDSDDSEEIFLYLQAASVTDLIENASKLNLEFGPVIEKEFPGVEAFITENPLDILASGRGAKIPTIIGRTAEEGAINLASNFSIVDDLRHFIPKILDVAFNSEKALELADELKKFYFNNAHIGMDNVREYLKLAGDSQYCVDIHRYIEILLKNSPKPIYSYRFSYLGGLNLMRKILESFGIERAGHMDELGYLFGISSLKESEASATDKFTRETMVQLWTNFAKSGNPTPEENNHLTVTWLPYTTEHRYYLDIDKELTLATNQDAERMTLWERWYHLYYKSWSIPGSPIKTDLEYNVVQNEPVNAHFEYQQDLKPADEEVDSNNLIETENTTTEKTEPTPERIDDPVELKIEEVVEEVAEETKDEVIEQLVEEVKDDVEEINNDVVEDVEDAIEEVKEEVIVDVKDNVIEDRNGVENENAAPVENGTGNYGLTAFKKDEQKAIHKLDEVINGEEKKNLNGKDIIRANDPPEDDLPKNIGVNKFVNFFESLGGKKK